jgi:hypothetical protein
MDRTGTTISGALGPAIIGTHQDSVEPSYFAAAPVLGCFSMAAAITFTNSSGV